MEQKERDDEKNVRLSHFTEAQREEIKQLVIDAIYAACDVKRLVNDVEGRRVNEVMREILSGSKVTLHFTKTKEELMASTNAEKNGAFDLLLRALTEAHLNYELPDVGEIYPQK